MQDKKIDKWTQLIFELTKDEAYVNSIDEPYCFL